VWCGLIWCGVAWCGEVWLGVVWPGLVWSGLTHANRQFIIYDSYRTDTVPVTEIGPDRCRILRIKTHFVTCFKGQNGLISVDGKVQPTQVSGDRNDYV